MYDFRHCMCCILIMCGYKASARGDDCWKYREARARECNRMSAKVGQKERDRIETETKRESTLAAIAQAHL